MPRIPCISLKTAGPIGERVDPGSLSPMPRRRADCEHAARPCPKLACRYHLMLDVKPSNGTIQINHADLEEMLETCALDMSREPHTQEEVAKAIGVSRKMAQIIERNALRKLSVML